MRKDTCDARFIFWGFIRQHSSTEWDPCLSDASLAWLGRWSTRGGQLSDHRFVFGADEYQKMPETWRLGRPGLHKVTELCLWDDALLGRSINLCLRGLRVCMSRNRVQHKFIRRRCVTWDLQLYRRRNFLDCQRVAIPICWIHWHARRALSFLDSMHSFIDSFLLVVLAGVLSLCPWSRRAAGERAVLSWTAPLFPFRTALSKTRTPWPLAWEGAHWRVCGCN